MQVAGTERADKQGREDKSAAKQLPESATKVSSGAKKPIPARGRADHPGIEIGEAVVQAKLSVGPAGDRYEREADAVAARVVRTLRSDTTPSADDPRAAEPRVQRSQSDVGGAGSGDEGDDESVDIGGRLRRIQRATMKPVVVATSITRIQRATSIGAAGGDLDDDTARMLKSSRSSGRPLDDEARSKMESAIGADFSGIRVHSGPTSAELNDRIQAKAFTAGSDIYFRDQVPDVSTSSGQELLAHELTHTVQQGSAPVRTGLGLQRSTITVQRWPWSKKKGAVIGAPTNVSLNGGNVKDGLNEQGFKPVPIQNAKIGTSGPMGVGGDRPSGWYASGGSDSTASAENSPALPGFDKHAMGAWAEGGKYGGVSAATGAAEGFTRLAANVEGAGMPVAGVAMMADGAMTWNKGAQLRQEGKEYDDAASTKLGDRKTIAGKAIVGAAAVSTAKAAVDVANFATVAKTGADVTKTALGATAMGAASAGLGIAAGSVMVIQGAWRGGQAVMKLCRLKWGRAAEMLSEQGARWKAYVANAEAAKIAINATKIALGALGIAAGALLLASNPIGWAIGIAAGIAGGIWAISKIASKINNAREKDAARKKIEANQPAEAVFDASAFLAELEREKTPGEKPPKYAEPGAKNDRKKAIDAANEVARSASSNARIAAEMRTALQADVNRDLIQQYLDLSETPDDDDDMFGDGSIADFRTYQETERLLGMMAMPERQWHDAAMILSSINVPYESAVADSGQDVIETKLTLTDAM